MVSSLSARAFLQQRESGPSDTEEKHGRTPETQALWAESDRLWHDGKLKSFSATLEKVVQIDPGDTEAWRYLAWNHAYNLSWELKAEAGKKAEIDRGIAILKRGILANPFSGLLRFELGWVIFDKVGDCRAAASQFQAAIATEKANGRKPPFYWRRMEAHCYEFLPDIETAVSLWRLQKLEAPDDHISHVILDSIVSNYLKPWRLYAKGKHVAALRLLDRDLKEPVDRRVRGYLRAAIFQKLRKPRIALQILQNMVSRGHDNAVLNFKIEQLRKELQSKAKP